jgi:dihydrodipicolinate synthase/N-acetylneuraminate lyase
MVIIVEFYYSRPSQRYLWAYWTSQQFGDIPIILYDALLLTDYVFLFDSLVKLANSDIIVAMKGQ